MLLSDSFGMNSFSTLFEQIVVSAKADLKPKQKSKVGSVCVCVCVTLLPAQLEGLTRVDPMGNLADLARFSLPSCWQSLRGTSHLPGEDGVMVELKAPGRLSCVLPKELLGRKTTELGN